MDSEDWKKKLRQWHELLDTRSSAEKIRDFLTSAQQKSLKGLLQESERHNLLMHPPKSRDELILSGTAGELSKILKGIKLPK